MLNTHKADLIYCDRKPQKLFLEHLDSSINKGHQAFGIACVLLSHIFALIMSDAALQVLGGRGENSANTVCSNPMLMWNNYKWGFYFVCETWHCAEPSTGLLPYPLHHMVVCVFCYCHLIYYVLCLLLPWRVVTRITIILYKI